MTPTLFSDEIEFTQISRSIMPRPGDSTSRWGAAPDVSLYAYLAAPAVVARRHLERVQRDQGDRRTRDDGRDLSRLRPCTARCLAAVRPLRRRRHGRRTGTLVFPLPRRRAARIPDVDPCAAADRESGHPSGPCVDRPRSTRLLRRHRRQTQLAILLPVLGLVLLGRVWRSERIRDWRSTWTRSDWIGAGTLLVGVTVGVSAVLGHPLVQLARRDRIFKSRMLEYGLWAFGALAIGIGILPLVAGSPRWRGGAVSRRTSTEQRSSR